MTITTKKSDQKGTLLIEAIAMLGLIAMVTPTLYKKSAERLQEIQDINTATQARMMGATIDTFVRSHLASLKDAAGAADGNVVRLCLDDNTDGCFSFGYSSDIPAGFRPGELKGFKDPEIYVRSDEGKLVYYILYPKYNDINQRRAARLASLVGANGGFVKEKKFVQGVGGAWELDSTMIDEMKFDGSTLTENSLVVTAPEPIVATIDDSDKYLYRVPDEEKKFHNTMVTNLFLGGHTEPENSGFKDAAQDFYSIFNVRKLTMNTDCKYGEIKGPVGGTSCIPADLADLYIGKPIGRFNEEDGDSSSIRSFGANRGAAWIYGNLSAVSDRFKVFHTDYRNVGGGGSSDISHRGGYDVLRFARTDNSSDGDVWDESSTVDLDVLRASNENGSAEVAMINGYVRAMENYLDQGGAVGRAFLVGGSSDADASSLLIEAFSSQISINNISNGTTRINPNGGDVYINGFDGSSGIVAHTYINPENGELYAGKDGNWMKAWDDGSTVVHMLSGGSSGTDSADRLFVVGNNDASSHMIYANEDKVSLRGGQISVYNSIKEGAGSSSAFGIGAGEDGAVSVSSGTTVIASRITDILGGTYMGNKAMNTDGDGVYYERNDGGAGSNHWTLGVAGSAWVDDLLYARKAWMSDAGFKDLHAGFSSFAEYSSEPGIGWLNVYGGGAGRVEIRNPDLVRGRYSSNISDSSQADTMFYADSTYTYIGDTVGAYAAFQDGDAYIGTKDFGGGRNYFAADSSDARVVGSTLAQIYTANTGADDFVDIQKGAMLFNGYSWTGDDRSTHTYDDNTIEAHAGKYMLHTKNVSSVTGESAAVFYADKSDIRTRYVDFSVENDSSVARFKVMPNEDPSSVSGSANVMVNGSFHVTGNEVIHIASNSSNAAGIDDDNPHAVFEVDPRFVKVMARDSAGNFIDAVGSSGTTDGKLAILKINPDDTLGGSSIADNTRDASVYIRRGAIELEESPITGSSAAGEGYGYIKANRLVSNVRGDAARVPTEIGWPVIKSDNYEKYDQFMVNPAYTSVMHDIKLTTRGGARLSDILPDYILKGVYNVSNDFIEGSKTTRIHWSCGKQCDNGFYSSDPKKVAWADTYVGIIPYAVCPRGYKNLATIVPISFRMGQAGEVIKADQLYSGVGYPSKSIKYVVNPSSRQTRHILSVASDGSKDIVYPWLQKAENYTYGDISSNSGVFPPNTFSRTEGWFWGVDAVYDGTGSTASIQSELEVETFGSGSTQAAAYHYKGGAAEHSDDLAGEDKNGIVAEPLYFQQNTFLKTALTPGSQNGISGWEGRMGFLYDKDVYIGAGTFDNTGIASNNNADGENESSVTNMPGNWIWNLFPVATNTLEGHATVYCYFDRTQFLGGKELNGGDWQGYIDPIDQMNKNKFRAIDSVKDSSYTRRLNDPSLKYDDPW